MKRTHGILMIAVHEILCYNTTIYLDIKTSSPFRRTHRRGFLFSVLVLVLTFIPFKYLSKQDQKPRDHTW